MKLSFTPSVLSGTVTAPPSKSCAHRALICAMLSDEESIIRNVSLSGDISATLGCIEALGRPYEMYGSTVRFPAASGWMKSSPLLPCHESGSTLRFMLPVSLLSGGATLTGTERLMTRGVELYEKQLSRKGIVFEKSDTSVTVSGHLGPGLYDIRGNVSSQYVTGLLFALPVLGKDSILRVLPPVESGAYIDLTLGMLSRFGVTADSIAEREYLIPASQHYSGTDLTVEGDWSNAAFLLAANMLGGHVTVEGLDSSSIQPDRACADLYERISAGDAVIDVSGCPDLAPILMAVSAGSGKGLTLTGTSRLKIKESDRASAMAEELWELGVETDMGSNCVRLFPSSVRPPRSALDGHNDHRIVMALSLLLTGLGGEICGAEAVSKSWPEYFTVLRQLGARFDVDGELI